MRRKDKINIEKIQTWIYQCYKKYVITIITVITIIEL